MIPTSSLIMLLCLLVTSVYSEVLMCRAGLKYATAYALVNMMAIATLLGDCNGNVFLWFLSGAMLMSATLLVTKASRTMTTRYGAALLCGLGAALSTLVKAETPSYVNSLLPYVIMHASIYLADVKIENA